MNALVRTLSFKPQHIQRGVCPLHNGRNSSSCGGRTGRGVLNCRNTVLILFQNGIGAPAHQNVGIVRPQCGYDGGVDVVLSGALNYAAPELGAEWAVQPHNLAGHRIASITKAADGAWVGCSMRPAATLVRSVDQGASWTVTANTTWQACSPIKTHPENSNVMVSILGENSVGLGYGYHALAISTNAGQTWSQTTIRQSQESTSYATTSENFLTAHNGRLYAGVITNHSSQSNGTQIYEIASNGGFTEIQIGGRFAVTPSGMYSTGGILTVVYGGGKNISGRGYRPKSIFSHSQ